MLYFLEGEMTQSSSIEVQKVDERVVVVHIMAFLHSINIYRLLKCCSGHLNFQSFDPEGTNLISRMTE